MCIAVHTIFRPVFENASRTFKILSASLPAAQVKPMPQGKRVVGRLTTHVLDTASGRPAAGLAVTLSDATGAVLAETATGADGRTPAPLLAGEAFRSGRYRLSFAVADYFRTGGVALSDPPFLDIVVIEFGIAESDGHYHVPLLVSPYGYSTYRGS